MFGCVSIILSCALFAVAGFYSKAADFMDGERAGQISNVPGRKLAGNGTTPFPKERFAFDDMEDDGCSPAYNCTAGGIPEARGICVNVGIGQQCWDVCNPKHTPHEYKVSEGAATNSAVAGLVIQVRAGMNSYVQCPPELGHGDACPLGRVCTSSMASAFNVPAGQGMCVIDENRTNSRACWDLCDEVHKPDDYQMAAEAGALERVLKFRQGGHCPSRPWWPWLLAILLTLCLLSCCVYLVLMLLKLGKKRTRGLDRGSRLDLEVAQEDALADGPHRELQTRVPPNFANDYADGYGRPQLSGSCEASLGMPLAPSYNEEEWRPPPEPPRMLDTPAAERELPSPPQPYYEEPAVRPVHNSHEEPSNRIDVYHNGMMQMGEREQFFPGSTSNRIPGLDEPNLFPNLAGSTLQQPGLPPPAEPYSIALPQHMLTVPQQPGNQPFRTATGSSPPSPSPFQTQLPPTFQTRLSAVTVPPMSGVTVPSSALTVPPSALTLPPSNITVPPVSGCSPPNSYHLRPQGSPPFFGQIGRC